MRIWRGRLLQLPSGSSNPLKLSLPRALARKASSIPSVLAHAPAIEVRRREVTWKLSMSETSEHWVSGAIGKRMEGDAWTDEGWQLGMGATGNATEFLIDLRNKIVYIRADSRVAPKAGTVVGYMTKLLNEALLSGWPNSDWVFDIVLEREVETFRQRFDEIHTLQVFSVRMAVRNGDGMDFLAGLRDRTDDMGGEKVNVTFRSRLGISKAASIVQDAIEMLPTGLLAVRAVGLSVPDNSGNRRSITASSEADGEPKEHEADLRDSQLRLAEAERVARELGLWDGG